MDDITVFLPRLCMDNTKKYITNYIIDTTIKIKDSVIPIYPYNDLKTELFHFTIENYVISNDQNRSMNSTTKLVPCPERPKIGSLLYNTF